MVEYDGLSWNAVNIGAGPKDRALIERIGNKNKHSSTLEHLYYNFDIDGISRACLQELARHRHTSLSVKSSRYTLKELRDEDTLHEEVWEGWTIARRYVVESQNAEVNTASYLALKNLQTILKTGVSNDIAKYCLPESYKTSLVWSINCRSLQNFLSLRTNKAALQEIRDLAYNIYKQLPEDHQYLFKDSLYEQAD